MSNMYECDCCGAVNRHKPERVEGEKHCADCLAEYVEQNGIPEEYDGIYAGTRKNGCSREVYHTEHCRSIQTMEKATFVEASYIDHHNLTECAYCSRDEDDFGGRNGAWNGSYIESGKRMIEYIESIEEQQEPYISMIMMDTGNTDNTDRKWLRRMEDQGIIGMIERESDYNLIYIKDRHAGDAGKVLTLLESTDPTT